MWLNFRKMAEAEDNGADLGGAPAEATPANTEVNADDSWGEIVSDADVTSVDIPAAPQGDVQVEPPAVAPAPTTPPVAAEPQVPPQAQTQPQAEAETPAQPVDMKALRAQYETELTQYYGLDPQTAERLQTEPELVLPQLAARVHLEVLDAVLAQLPQRVNAMLQNYNTTTARESEAETTFFGAYPDLREHKDAVLRVGQMYRAANPKASKEQAVKAIGDFVRQSLGLQAPAIQQAPQQPQVKPFTPAAGGGNGAPATQSEWDFVTQDDD